MNRWIRLIISKLNIELRSFFEIRPCSKIKASDSVFVIIVSIYLIEDLSLAILLPSSFLIENNF